MSERLIKGKFILAVLGLLAVFALAMADKLESTQAGLSLVAVVTAFLHFEDKV